MKKLIFLVPILLSQVAIAHPGRTASDGCHYCRTNCSTWGVPWGERHCHYKPSPISGETTSDTAIPEKPKLELDGSRLKS